MTSVREASRQRKRDTERLPPNVRIVDETVPKGHEWTQLEAANQLGIHRTVLYRMEQRNEIPKPRWRRRNSKGNPYRVYNAEEIANIKKIIEEKRAERDKGRQYVEEEQV